MGFYGSSLCAIAAIIAVAATIIYTKTSEEKRRKQQIDKEQQDLKIAGFKDKLLQLVKYLNPRFYMGFSTYSKYESPISFKSGLSMYNEARYHMDTIKIYLEIEEVDSDIKQYLKTANDFSNGILPILEERETIVHELNSIYSQNIDDDNRVQFLVSKLKAYDVIFNQLENTTYHQIINDTREIVNHYAIKIRKEKCDEQ